MYYGIYCLARPAILRSIKEATSNLESILELTRAVYDTRVVFTPEDYETHRASVASAIAKLIETRENLRDVLESSAGTPIVSSSNSSRQVLRSSIRLPLRAYALNAISNQTHLSLSPPSRVFSFTYTGTAITGVSIVRGPALESAYRFSLTPSSSDYVSAGISVDWTANQISLADEVACISLDNTRATRSSGLLDTLSGQPLAYWPIGAVADAFAAEASVTKSSTSLTISNGVVIDGNVSEGELISVDGGSYVLEAGSLHTYSASKPSSDLNGDYSVSVISTTLQVPGEYTFVESETSPHYGDLSIDASGVKRGDVVYSGLASVGVVSEGGEQSLASVSGTFAGGRVDVYAETYVILNELIEVLDQITDVELLSTLSRRDDLISTASQCESLTADLSFIRSAVEETSCPDEVRRVWYTLRGVHLRAGLDRAADTLSNADLASYRSLDDSNASYSNLLADLADDLIVKVQQ